MHGSHSTSSSSPPSPPPAAAAAAASEVFMLLLSVSVAPVAEGSVPAAEKYESSVDASSAESCAVFSAAFSVTWAGGQEW